MADHPFIELGNLIPGTLTVDASNADYKVREIRSKLYKQYPNEEMLRYPLTKIVLSGKGRPIDRTKVEWGMEGYYAHYTRVFAVYRDPNANNTVNLPQIKGSIVYVAVPENDGKSFIPMEDVEIRAVHKTTGMAHSIIGDVEAILNLSSSNFKLLQVKLSENETANTNMPCVHCNHGADYDCYVSMLSYAAPENSTIPPGRFREPTVVYNYSQIIMAGLSITGSELADRSLFDEETYARYMRQTMDRFHEQFERMIKFGVRDEFTTTVNYFGQTENVKRWRCGGLTWAHKTLGGNYIRIPEVRVFEGYDFTGKKWETHGELFMQLLMNRLSKKSGSAKKVFVSSTGRLIFNELFKAATNVTVGTYTKDKWGFDVEEIRGMNCRLELQQDAGLSMNPAWERLMFIVEPDKIEFRPRRGRDLTVIRSKKDAQAAVENGWTWRDGIREGVFIDGSITFDDLDGMAVVDGIGHDFATA